MAANHLPVSRPQAAQHIRGVVLAVVDLLVAQLLDAPAGLEALGPEQLPPAPGRRGVLDKQPPRSLTAVPVARQEPEGVHALTALARPLGQLPVGPPVALIVHFGQVVAGIAPPPHIDRVLIEASITIIQQPCPPTGRPPAPYHVQAQRLGVAVARDEPQFVRMGVPAILAVRDLQ